MRIGIEAQRIFRLDKHGMDFVILEVLRQLQLRHDNNEYFVFVAPGQDHCIESTQRMHIIELKSNFYPLWEQWRLLHAVQKTKINLLHCTSNTAPIYCPVPLIITLHDIIYLTTPKSKSMSHYQQLGWHYRRWNVPKILNKCQQIITVSETEYINILHHFPSLDNKLTVVHNGYSNCYHPMDKQKVYEITNKYLSDEKYLLFLGNTDPRKNIVGVLIAYNDYLSRSIAPLKLVITGVKQEYVEKLLADNKLKGCISNLVFTNYIPAEDLPALYNGAFAFLYPSLLEGFGIPVLEAMACGIPVITSNCSSLPEVAGKEAILINPQNAKEIADAIIRLENDNHFYQQQSAYGVERVKQFSWKKTAEAYVKRYDSILNNS